MRAKCGDKRTLTMLVALFLFCIQSALVKYTFTTASRIMVDHLSS